MARRKKKLNKGLATFLGIVFFCFGLVAGFAVKTYILPDSSYEIPGKHTTSSSIAVGDVNVELIKDEDLSIHFVELGNKYTGDCTFIKAGDTEVLIDAGSRTSSIKPIHDYIMNYITDGELEYVIVTHAHRDHYAGFATNDSLFDSLNASGVTIGEVVTFSKTNQKETSGLYKEFIEELDELEDENSTVISTVLDYCSSDGTKIKIDLDTEIELEFLYHKYYEEKAPSENDYSVCCMINQGVGAGKRHYLFTGDLEEDGEANLIEKNTLPQVELYKAGHHGSKTSSSAEFLEVIQPKIVCVCACAGSPEYTKTKDNQFPTQQFIDRIALYTDAVYVTTLCVDYDKAEFVSMNGNIVISASKGVSTVVSCAGSKDKLKDSEWFKQNRVCPERWAS